MPKGKKNTALDESILNYSKYKYSDILEHFSEHDRLLENELSNLECYNEYQLEKPLNSFEDRALNDHLYRVYYSNKTETTLLMQWWISYFVHQHQKQITFKVREYLDSKKLLLDDWLQCVNEGRRGDILCVYLLSIATGVHTMIHLKNKLWCKLRDKPQSHEEMLNCCEKHLVYLSFGIFLCLEKRPPPTLDMLPILGTVSSDDPATQRELLYCVGVTIKTKSAFTGTTPAAKTAKHLKASAAAGSKAQLERVGAKMKAEPSTIKPQATSHKTIPRTYPMVEKYPFEVRIRRLTLKEIEKYTVSLGQTKCPCTVKPSVVTIRSSLVTTRSMAKRKLNKGQKWHTISGHLSQLPTQQRPMFKVRKHILHKHKHKNYMKCRVKDCALAYITFNTVNALNTHHQIYHGNIVYKCHKCKKMINTPSTWRFHKYCQKPKVCKCDHCDEQFMFRSKLKQHKCKHI